MQGSDTTLDGAAEWAEVWAEEWASSREVESSTDTGCHEDRRRKLEWTRLFSQESVGGLPYSWLTSSHWGAI